MSTANDEYDAIVVGVGGMGSATTYHLACRGLDVLGLERYDIPHTHPQVAVGAGFSGHDFKFASVIGEILADLVTDGDTDHPIGMFRLNRFE